MPACAARHAQIVQATSDQHNHVREAVFRVTKLVLGSPTDFDAGNRMLDPDACAREFPVAALLARL
jgi:hypothetical protein